MFTAGGYWRNARSILVSVYFLKLQGSSPTSLITSRLMLLLGMLLSATSGFAWPSLERFMVS